MKEVSVTESTLCLLLMQSLKAGGGFLMCGMSLLREALCVCVSDEQSELQS